MKKNKKKITALSSLGIVALTSTATLTLSMLSNSHELDEHVLNSNFISTYADTIYEVEEGTAADGSKFNYLVVNNISI